MGKNIVLVYTCTALIICEINTCNVPPYKEFNVIIFKYVCLWSRDTYSGWPPFQPKIVRRFIYNSSSALNIQLAKKKMLANLCDYFVEKIVVLHIEGCASIAGFRDVVGKTVKMVKYDGVDDESVDIVVRRLKAEVLALPRSNDYDLSQFTFEKTVANTCPTLLALVS